MVAKELNEKHPCMLPEGVLQGYICPLCLAIYANKDQAIQCKESHEDFEVDYVFEKGRRFPIEVLIKRVKGKEVKEVATYKTEKIEVIEDGKVKETIRESN